MLLFRLLLITGTWWARLLNNIAGILDAGVPSVTNSYESIATVTVGAGGSSTITFSSIPSTYKHLQIRGISHSSYAAGNISVGIRYNSDSTANQAYHYLNGDGSIAGAGGNIGYTYQYATNTAGTSYNSNVFAGTIIDILDYANTNKYKTTRSLNGVDGNGSGQIVLISTLWQSTSAITQIDITTAGLGSFNQYSTFALYGIKG